MREPFSKVAGEMTGKWAEVLFRGVTDLIRSVFVIVWAIGVLGISPVLFLLLFVLHTSLGETIEPLQGSNKHERS